MRKWWNKNRVEIIWSNNVLGLNYLKSSQIFFSGLTDRKSKTLSIWIHIHHSIWMILLGKFQIHVLSVEILVLTTGIGLNCTTYNVIWNPIFEFVYQIKTFHPSLILFNFFDDDLFMLSCVLWLGCGHYEVLHIFLK